ncbi:NUDIX domain-containing protein, partial [Paraburkholderia sp. BR10872]|uniref:NUDIX domain-containing protein n=1 Tax=Paraburkholderia sp. BR10872 TaxID=3236989 RepID=UPI0034D15B00
LLVYSNVPGVKLRLPGGNIDSGETEEEALFREILEESGLADLEMVKKLGTPKYYKEIIDSNVERHDFLMVSREILPEDWEYIGTGKGGDQGNTFKFQW